VPLTPWQRRLLDAESDPWRLWFLAIGQPIVGVFLLTASPSHGKAPIWMRLLGIGLIGLGGLAFKVLGWRAEDLREKAATPVTHQVKAYRDLPDFGAYCSCGWHGDDHTSLEPALQEAQQHAGVRPRKVEILDEDDGTDEIREVDVDEAEPPEVHEVNVYWDHRVFAPSCSCGWQGAETELVSDAVGEAKAHGKVEDVEVTDIGRRED
jgi:hypothetical protein